MTGAADLALEGIGNPAGHLVHVGAGSGAELARWRAAPFMAITLIEPDPDAAAALEREAIGDARIRVIAVALSDETGPLLRYDFTDLSSLRPPTAALRRLYPGLPAAEPVRVRIERSEVLIVDLDLPETLPNVLVLEAPGQAAAILAALGKIGLLDRFFRIVVQEGQESLYEGQAPMKEISELLAAAGFALPRQSNADPDRPHLAMTRDAREDELRALRARCKELTDQVAEQAGELSRATVQLGEAEQRVRHLESLLNDAQDKLASQVDLKKRFETLEADHQRQAYLLTLSRDEMLKAEGQFALLSDLLMRGSSL